MFRHLVKILYRLIILALVMAGMAFGLLLWYVEQPFAATEQTLEVSSGSNLTKVAKHLAAQGLLESPLLLVIYARLLDRENIQAGEYLLTTQDSLKSLLAKFNNGDVVTYQINFPEGLAYRDWVFRLQQEPKLKHLAGPYLEQLPLLKEHPEGWFFPDTYTFSAADSALDILRAAHARMQVVLEEEWQNRQAGLPYQTPYQALTMASIIEKETGAAFEREKIAGVFVRRLKKRMRLQTDPTVIYGLGENYQGNLTRKHLREDTPYNTYLHRGLPPTPIAMPGRAAIRAALNPAAGEELYFVAKGDGTHHFSESLEEHLKAVREFQLNRAANYRSSPTNKTSK